MMSDNAPTHHPQHAPAMRVGGRRMSLPPSFKHRPEVPTDDSGTPAPATPVDYPRPAPPTEEHAPREDEAPRKERRQSHGARDEFRARERVRRAADDNRPRKVLRGGQTNGAERRLQPEQKAFI